MKKIHTGLSSLGKGFFQLNIFTAKRQTFYILTESSFYITTYPKHLFINASSYTTVNQAEKKREASLVIEAKTLGAVAHEMPA